MSIGLRVHLLRLQSNRTQRDLARAAGLAVPYLSRLEHDHIVPSVRTLLKIAAALGVQVGAFFNGATSFEAMDRCPISISGRCILDEPFVARATQSKGEEYTARQLETLRLCNVLLHTGDLETGLALHRTVVSLLAQAQSRQPCTGR